MTGIKTFGAKLVPLLCVAITFISTPLHAAGTAAAATIHDVALQDGGVLMGQIVSSAGAPLANATVRISHRGTEVASVVTSEQGQFAVRGLQGGVYQVSTDHGSGVFRVWATGTAPQNARQGLVFVAQDDVVRGQIDHGTALRTAGVITLLGLGIWGIVELVDDSDAS